MKEFILLFLKGIAMGIANVIPGVSGGTIALITNIYEKLILSLKSFNLKAVNLILRGNIKEFIIHTNFYFLLSVFSGSIFSVFSIAKLFKYLFDHHPVLIWSFFFGLILASIYYIGKRVNKWTINNILILIIGTIVAIGISFLEPANENSNLFFVFICGFLGIIGMILPGLSGSFILILLGNYQLLLVTAIIEFNYILLTFFVLGSIAGLVGFSHIIAWLLNKYKNQTLAALTGFVLGSLYIIWPWKEIGKMIIIDGKEKILSYNWLIPSDLSIENIIAIALIIFGIFIVYLLENTNTNK